MLTSSIIPLLVLSVINIIFQEIDHVMQAGKKNRSVGATLMNQTSSRSHSIFTIVVECAEMNGQGDHIRVGKLNLVDLAGSERQGKVNFPKLFFPYSIYNSTIS